MPRGRNWYMSEASKDRWDKVEIVGRLAGAVAVPLVLLLLGQWLTHSFKEGEVSARQVELAIDVLKQNPDVRSDIPGLRQWASETLRDNLSLGLPAESSEALLEKRLPVSSERCCVRCGGLITCGHMVYTECGFCGPEAELREFDLVP